MIIILLILFYILIPVFILFLTGKNKLAARLGAVIIAYIMGLIMGHSGFIPQGSENFHSMINAGTKVTMQQLQESNNAGLISNRDLVLFNIRNLQDNLMSVAILLAIPLLLFSCNVRDWFRMAGKTLIALITGVFAVLVVIVSGYFIFRDKIPEAWKISGMLVGVYTGGTPNLAALKMMLDVKPDVYIMTHTYDTLVGAFFLFFLVSIGKRVFGSFLPAYPFRNVPSGETKADPVDEYKGILKRQYLLPILLALLASILIVGTSVGVSFLFYKNMNTVIIILTLTTLGILVSLVPRINRIEKTFETGMYLILIFSVVVASMANFRQLINISSALFLYITFAVMGSLVLHAFLSWIFKVDADTLIIAHTALVCSPPFVPMVAGALRNREVVIAGLTIGIIGYAVGNYLGVALAFLLRGL